MNIITLPAGNYYVGDMSYALDKKLSLDLENGLYEIKKGVKIWITKTKNTMVTLYSQDGRAWGVDTGFFGCMLYKDLDTNSSYRMHEIEFNEEFNVTAAEDSITVGHLVFTYDPPENVRVKGLHLPGINFYHEEDNK